MKFTNEIRLALPADDVFDVLTDVERVASCLPGARLEGRDGDAYRGAMRVKVGPIATDYAGTLTFAELDREGRRAVLLALGEEKAGQGSAEAQIVSSVHDDGAGARVVVETELQVRGRVAQFGSGAMEKIAKRMFADFAKNLEALMTETEPEQLQPEDQPGEAAAQGSAPSAADGGRDGDALDVVGLVVEPLRASLRSWAIPAIIAFIIGYLLGRSRGRS